MNELKTVEKNSTMKMESPSNQFFIDAKIDKKIVYPIFKECTKYTLDPFWIQIFNDFSHGKFLKQTLYLPQNNVFQIKLKETYSIQLTNVPQDDFLKLKKSLQEKLNIRSKQDKQQIRDNMETIRNTIENLYAGEWKQIRKKNIREAILRTYIMSLQDKYSLTKDELNDLFKMISVAISFNWITPNHIEFNDKQIHSISNLKFNENERKFYIDKIKNPIKREVEVRTNTLYNLWCKCLDVPKNRYNY